MLYLGSVPGLVILTSGFVPIEYLVPIHGVAGVQHAGGNISTSTKDLQLPPELHWITVLVIQTAHARLASNWAVK